MERESEKQYGQAIRMTMDEVEGAMAAQEAAFKVPVAKRTKKPIQIASSKRRRVASEMNGPGEGVHTKQAGKTATRLSERQMRAKGNRQSCGEHDAGSNQILDHREVVEENELDELPSEGVIPRRPRPSLMSSHWEGMSEHASAATRVLQKEFTVMNFVVESEVDQLQKDIDYAESNHIPVTMKSWIARECRSMITAAFKMCRLIVNDDEEEWLTWKPVDIISCLRQVFVGGGNNCGGALTEVLRRFRQIEVPRLGESRENDMIFMNRINTLVENYVDAEVRQNPEKEAMRPFREALMSECRKNVWGTELFSRIQQQAKEFAWRPWFQVWLKLQLEAMETVEKAQPFKRGDLMNKIQAQEMEPRMQSKPNSLVHSRKRTRKLSRSRRVSKMRRQLSLVIRKGKSRTLVVSGAGVLTIRQQSVVLVQQGRFTLTGIQRKYPGRRVHRGKDGWQKARENCPFIRL